MWKFVMCKKYLLFVYHYVTNFNSLSTSLFLSFKHLEFCLVVLDYESLYLMGHNSFLIKYFPISTPLPKFPVYKLAFVCKYYLCSKYITKGDRVSPPKELSYHGAPQMCCQRRQRFRRHSRTWSFQIF